jgi:DNA-binding NtrC family response regulator
MSQGEDGGRRDDELPPPSLSPQVQLEIAILAAEMAAPAHAPAAQPHARSVLIIAADADLRRYIADCLSENRELHVAAAGSVADAVVCAQQQPPQLILVDAPNVHTREQFHGTCTIVVVDELPAAAQRVSDASTTAPVAYITRPFNARSLLELVDRLLA